MLKYVVLASILVSMPALAQNGDYGSAPGYTGGGPFRPSYATPSYTYPSSPVDIDQRIRDLTSQNSLMILERENQRLRAQSGGPAYPGGPIGFTPDNTCAFTIGNYFHNTGEPERYSCYDGRIVTWVDGKCICK